MPRIHNSSQQAPALSHREIEIYIQFTLAYYILLLSLFIFSTPVFQLLLHQADNGPLHPPATVTIS